VELDGDGHYETTTDEEGYYHIICEPGDYALVTNAQGYQEYSEDITIGTGANSRDILLTPGSSSGNQLPTVNITSLVNGSVVKGTVRISGTASDPDGSVSKIELSINGGQWLTVTGAQYWYYDWITKDVENGGYVIMVRSYDGEDYSEEQVMSVTVENEKDDDEDFEIGGMNGYLVISMLAALVIVVVVIVLMTGGRSESAVMGSDRCPSCGRRGDYSEEYEDHYCWSCQEYFDDME